MNYQSYLKEIKKLNKKLEKAIRTGSYKHYKSFKNKIWTFKKNNQEPALQDYLDSKRKEGIISEDYQLHSIFS